MRKKTLAVIIVITVTSAALLGLGLVAASIRRSGAEWRASLTMDDREHIAKVTQELKQCPNGTILKFRKGNSKFVLFHTSDGLRLVDFPGEGSFARRLLDEDDYFYWTIERSIQPNDPEYPECAKKFLLQGLAVKVSCRQGFAVKVKP